MTTSEFSCEGKIQAVGFQVSLFGCVVEMCPDVSAGQLLLWTVLLVVVAVDPLRASHDAHDKDDRSAAIPGSKTNSENTTAPNTMILPNCCGPSTTNYMIRARCDSTFRNETLNSRGETLQSFVSSSKRIFVELLKRERTKSHPFHLKVRQKEIPPLIAHASKIPS